MAYNSLPVAIAIDQSS